jgi:hypothetical protein
LVHTGSIYKREEEMSEQQEATFGLHFYALKGIRWGPQRMDPKNQRFKENEPLKKNSVYKGEFLQLIKQAKVH